MECSMPFWLPIANNLLALAARIRGLRFDDYIASSAGQSLRPLRRLDPEKMAMGLLE